MKQERWRDTATLDDALSHGLSAGEFEHICDVLGRPVTMVELGICSALFSEHCSYKSSKVYLKTLPTEGKRVIQGPGENAGVVDIGDGEAVVFKIESHNHPSFIEPYQGAATGVGGILRDVFTMGARPVALMNSLRFGMPTNPRTKYLLRRSVAGIGGYGNCMGVPTVGGELFFHESYDGNCLVNAFALGLVDHDKIFLGTASGVGNSIFYVGSKTGRDGIHGATMASAEFDENSDEKRPTVQVGDPFQEKLLLEACLEVMQTGAVVGIQDMGAAGMTSSTYEMADRAGTGVRLDLEKVPQRESDMNPYEIMLSESQERMLIVVERGREEEVLRVFRHWGLDAVKIGEVVEGGNVDLHWQGELISSIPVSLLTSAVPQYRWPERAPDDLAERQQFEIASLDQPGDLSALWLELLGSINLSSRHPVFQQYDSTVRTNTIIHPGGDAAVIRVKRRAGAVQAGGAGESVAPEKGIAMTLDCNSRYCGVDPHQGAALSLAEACRNIAAVGAEPIGLSNCLNFGNPQREEGMWQIAEGIRGMAEAARAFDIPIISGNVSLYNETKGKPILPTPVMALVGLIDDASKCIGIHFRSVGDMVFVIGAVDDDRLGGSEYLANRLPRQQAPLPLLNYDLERKTADLIRALIAVRLLKSCHDVSGGGLALAFAECCLSTYGSLGARLEMSQRRGRKDVLLFSEAGARYVVSCAPENAAEVRSRITSAGLSISAVGEVGGDRITIKDIAELELMPAEKCWREGLQQLL